MINITTRCFKCRTSVEVVDIEIHTDGVTMVLKCGHTMRKYWKPDR